MSSFKHKLFSWNACLLFAVLMALITAGFELMPHFFALAEEGKEGPAPSIELASVPAGSDYFESGFVTPASCNVVLSADCNDPKGCGTEPVIGDPPPTGFTDWDYTVGDFNHIAFGGACRRQCWDGSWISSPSQSCPPRPNYVLTARNIGTGSGQVSGTRLNCNLGPGEECSNTHYALANVTLNAAANPGSTFSNWANCNSTSGSSCTVTMNGNRTVDVVFNAHCSDSIDNEPDGFTDYPADPGCVDDNDTSEIDPLSNLISSNLNLAEGTYEEGQQVRFSATVENTGSVSTGGTFDDQFTYRWDGGAWDTWTGSTLTGIGPLASDGSRTDNSPWLTLGQSGTLDIQHCVDHGDQINEDNEGDNCSILASITVDPAEPNLTSENLALNSGSLQQGSTVRFSASVRNNGTADTPTGFSDNFTYQWGGTSGTWNQWSTVSKGILVQGNTSPDISSNLSLTQTGDLYIQHCIDAVPSSGVIAESDESVADNCSEIGPLSVSAAPQTLSVTCDVSPASTEVGNNVTWTASVSGGTAPYTFDWEGTAPLNTETSNQAVVSYSTAGTKTGSVTVTDASAQSAGPVNCASDHTATPAAGGAPSVNLTGNGSSVDTISITEGDDVDLTWTIGGGAPDSCQSIGFTTTMPPYVSGGPTTVTPSLAGSPHNYTLVCENASGGHSDTVTVMVQSSAPPPELNVNKQYARFNEPFRLDWDTNNSNEGLCTLTGPGLNLLDLTGPPAYDDVDLGNSDETGAVDRIMNGTAEFVLNCGGMTDSVEVQLIPGIWES